MNPADRIADLCAQSELSARRLQRMLDAEQAAAEARMAALNAAFDRMDASLADALAACGGAK